MGAGQRLWQWCRRNPALAAASGLALGGLFLAAVIGWLGYAGTRAALAEKETEHQAVLAAQARTEATLRSRASARLGEVLQRQGDTKTARSEPEAARALLNDLIGRFPHVPNYRLQRGEVLLTLGSALREEGPLAESRITLETALQDLDIYLQAEQLRSTP